MDINTVYPNRPTMYVPLEITSLSLKIRWKEPSVMTEFATKCDYRYDFNFRAKPISVLILLTFYPVVLAIRKSIPYL